MAEAVYNGVDNLDVMAQLAPNYNRFLARLVEKNLPGKNLADFGAGTGTFAEMLIVRGHHVTCIEPDTHLLQTLKSKKLNAHASLDALPEKSLPAVFTLNVLEHIEDDLAAMKQIYSRLQPGGQLLVYVPAFKILFSSMDRKVGHYRRYTRAMLCSRLKQAGFQIQRARYADSLGFAASLAYKCFGNDRGDLNPAALKTYDRWIFPISRVLDLPLQMIAGKNVVALARRPKD